MSKFKLLILAGVVGFFIGRFVSEETPEGKTQETHQEEQEVYQEEQQELINGFAYLDALEKAADLAFEKSCCDGRLRQLELNFYSGLAASITELWAKSLDTEIRLSEDFPLIEKEYEAECWEWEETFKKETAKPSIYEGGSAARMERSMNRSRLLWGRAEKLKSKWLSRLPVPYFEKPEPPTEEELEAWEEIEADDLECIENEYTD